MFKNTKEMILIGLFSAASFSANGAQDAKAAAVTPNPAQVASSERVSPEAGLTRLLEGNKRFMNDKSTCPDRNQERRLAIVAKQKPFAIVVGCSDSRIPPEIAFDQGLGDIFVVRTAGNVIGDVELDSAEYSVLANDSSIIMVLGHQNCGAVTAVYEGNTSEIESVAVLIRPAIIQAKQKHLGVDEAILENINNSVDRLNRSPVIGKMVKAGKVKVVGAYYDLTTGEAKIVNNQ